jgi:hypothetical protein
MKAINMCYGRKWSGQEDAEWNDTADKVWLNLSCDFVPAAPHVGRVNNVRAESVKLKAKCKQVYWSFLPAPVKLVRILTGRR